MATIASVFERLHVEFDFDASSSSGCCFAAPPASGSTPSTPGSVLSDGAEPDQLSGMRWGARTFLFPPMMHSRRWLRAALTRLRGGGTELVVVLLPFRPASVHFAEWVFPHAAQVRIVWDRLVLPGYAQPAKFAYCVVVYGTPKAALPPAPAQPPLTDRIVTLRAQTLGDVLAEAEANLGRRFKTVLRSAAEADLDRARSWATPAFVSTHTWVHQFFVRARDEASSGGAVYLVLPCRPETRYFLKEMLPAGAVQQIWFLAPNLIYDGFATKCRHASMVLVWNVRSLPRAPIGARLSQF